MSGSIEIQIMLNFDPAGIIFQITKYITNFSEKCSEKL